MLYGKGEGARKDPVEAVKWLKLAAEQGHAAAQLQLGVGYYVGDSIGRDPVEAIKWLTLAAEQDIEEAFVALEEFRVDLSRDQENQARNRAEEWKRKHSARVR